MELFPNATRIVAKKTTDLCGDFASLGWLAKTSVETPQDYVRRIIAEKGLSHVKVAQRAKQLGGKLSPGYVNNIIQGHTESPGIDMIYNLSLGLGEPVEDLIAVYLGQVVPWDGGFRKSAFYGLYTEAEKLSESDRREVKVLIDALKSEIQRRTAKS